MKYCLFRYPGGKAYQIPEIVRLIGNPSIFVEPFCGNATVSVNRDQSHINIANDIDPNIYRVWTQLKNNTEAFISTILPIEYSEENFHWAVPADGDDDLILALKYLVRNRLSFDGMRKHYVYSTRVRGGRDESINTWENLKGKLPKIAERIQTITFYNEDFIKVIGDRDSQHILNQFLLNKNACFYVDSPYLSEKRTKNLYDFEMTDDDHRRLLSGLTDRKARVIISGYPSDLYEEYLGGWNRKTFDRAANMGAKDGKKNSRRIEVLWSNF
jgi:DNA adenine methylase